MRPHRSLFSQHPLAQLAVAFSTGVCGAEYLAVGLIFLLVPGAVCSVLALVFFHGHHLVFAGTKRILLNEPESFFTVQTLIASVVNAGLALALFPVLDRLRKS